MFGSLLGGIASGIGGMPHAGIPNLGLLGLSHLFSQRPPSTGNTVQTTTPNMAQLGQSLIQHAGNPIGLMTHSGGIGNMGIGGIGGNILGNADMFQHLIMQLLGRFGVAPPSPPISGPHPQPGTQAYSNMNYPIGMTPGAGQF